MSENNDFYIGWQEKMPKSYALKVRQYVIVALMIVALVAVSFVMGQRGFAASVFEYGELTTIEGVLIKSPVPMLKIQEDGNIKSVILVGFGKFGAEETIDSMERGAMNLEFQSVRLRGTRIYHDGKELLELTEGFKAFQGFGAMDLTYEENRQDIGRTGLRGEILDPKCAFGVMKPGEGKTHRSCAARCIEGGMPPVLKMVDKKGKTNYAIVRGAKGQSINIDLVEYVAQDVYLCGELYLQDDWLVLEMNPKEDLTLLPAHWSTKKKNKKIPMCSD